MEVEGRRFDAGTIVIERQADTDARIAGLAEELHLDFVGVAERPGSGLQEMRAPRVGLYQGWVANMEEGWARWLLQNQYGFLVDTLQNDGIRNGDLSRYDVIVFPSQETEAIMEGHAAGTMPEEYVGGIGPEGVQALRRFVENGGRLVALDRATDFAIEEFGLPVRSATRSLPPEEFFIPGSVVRLRTDPTSPLALGMPEEAAAFFTEDSGGFDVVGSGGRVDIPVRWGDRDVLMSGFELGAEQHLAGKAAVVGIGVGKGDVVLVGFSPYFRGMSTGTYKLLFNAIYGAGAVEN